MSQLKINGKLNPSTRWSTNDANKDVDLANIYRGYYIIVSYYHEFPTIDENTDGSTGSSPPTNRSIYSDSRFEVLPNGDFEITVPPKDDLVTGEITLEVRAADGSIVYTETRNVSLYHPDNAQKYEISDLDPILFGVSLESNSIPTTLKVKGRVIDISGTSKVSNLQVILWGTDSDEDEIKFDSDFFKPIYVGKTDKDGYFFGSYTPKVYTKVVGVVANSLEQTISIEFDTIKTQYSVLKRPIILALNFKELDIDTEDCACGTGTPMLPDSSALIDSPNSFAQDLGGGCVSFTTPNRTLEEFTFYQVVRTTEPEIKGLTLNPRDVRLIRKELININKAYKVKIDKIQSAFLKASIFKELVASDTGTVTPKDNPGAISPQDPSAGQLGGDGQGDRSVGRQKSSSEKTTNESSIRISRGDPTGPGGEVLEPVQGTFNPNRDFGGVAQVFFATPEMIEQQLTDLQGKIEEAVSNFKVIQSEIEKYENTYSTSYTLEEITKYRKSYNDLEKSIITFSDLLDDFKDLYDNYNSNILISDPYLVNNYSSLKSTFQDYLNKIKVRLDELERAYIADHAGRNHVSVENPIDWDDEPTVYQNTTVAHGHLLTIKQQWKAAGYSMGDLLYSLPLAPGQKKQIAVFDWDRGESASRSEIQTNEEQLTSHLSRDRAVMEMMKSSFAESLSARSEYSGKSSGFSVGASGGFSKKGVLSKAVGLFKAGAKAGTLIGVSGGFSSNKTSGSSSANQNSSRNLAANSLNNLKDSIQQSATSVRSQRSTVIQTVNQGESFSVTTEVIANHNHCHSLTIQYFEVLRHLIVEQNLVEVSECLFVPLEMSMFNMDKILRWKNSLSEFLLDGSLLGAFDALERIKEEYKHSNLKNVSGSYAEETIEDYFGELRISFEIPRPTDPINEVDLDDTEKGSIVEQVIKDTWKPWKPFMIGNWENSVALFRKHFYKRLAEQREKIFEEQVVPELVEQFVKQLEIKAVFDDNSSRNLELDVTLISKYERGIPLYVSLRSTSNSYGIIRRNRIKQILIHSPADIPSSSKIILHSGSLRYSTQHLNEYLFNSNNIKNDLIHNDAATIYTPLNNRELVNPKNEDYKLANHLIEHLNEHLEYYHRQLWQYMDKGRLFNLLDGFIAPNAKGKSLSSVVENNIIGVVGNNLILKVAAGYNLDPTFKISAGFDLLEIYKPLTPPDPFRISVPTRGVYAEAVMGQCNSCEHIDESRFWRWTEVPTGDEPTAIQPISTESRRVDPGDLQTKNMESPVVNIQNAPSAPDPTGLGAALQLMGTAGIFRDITGLDGTQINALAQLAQATAAQQNSQNAASHALDVAANLEKQKRAQQNSQKVVDDINMLFKDQPEVKKELLKKHFKTITGEDIDNKNPLLDSPVTQQALDQGKDVTISENGNNLSFQDPKNTIRYGDNFVEDPFLRDLLDNYIDSNNLEVSEDDLTSKILEVGNHLDKSLRNSKTRYYLVGGTNKIQFDGVVFSHVDANNGNAAFIDSLNKLIQAKNEFKIKTVVYYDISNITDADIGAVLFTSFKEVGFLRTNSLVGADYITIFKRFMAQSQDQFESSSYYNRIVEIDGKIASHNYAIIEIDLGDLSPNLYDRSNNKTIWEKLFGFKFWKKRRVRKFYKIFEDINGAFNDRIA